MFNVTWKFLLLLRMFTKLDTFPILINACLWKILGTFYPIWTIMDNFQQPRQWGFDIYIFYIYSIKTILSNISTRYEQETTFTFFFETPCKCFIWCSMTIEYLKYNFRVKNIFPNVPSRGVKVKFLKILSAPQYTLLVL